MSDTSGANPSGATNVHDIASILGTPPEPEQPTGGQEDVKIDEGEQKTSEKDDNEPSPNRFTTKLGDQDIEFECLTEGVDLKLLSPGLMFEADYRKKTATLADARRANEGIRTEIDAALKDAKLLIGMDLDTLEANTQLKEDDSEEYLRQLDAITARTKTFGERQAQRDKELQEKAGEIRANEMQLLEEAIPGWLDEKVKTEEVGLMIRALDDVGFDDETKASLADTKIAHRVLLLARKAGLYDQIMSKDLVLKKDPDPGPTLTPGAGNETEVSEKITAARGRLSKTGKIQALADVFSGL